MSSIGTNTTAAAFIGASVTLVLVIIFMVLMVILVRQCLAFMAKRNAIRQQIEQHRQHRQEMERQRRLSVTEPVTPTFDWHHSIRIAGTPPPTYHEAKKLPAFDDSTEVKGNNEKKNEIDIPRGSSADNDVDSELSIHIMENTSVSVDNSDNNNDTMTDNRAVSMAEATERNETVIDVEYQAGDRPAAATTD